MEQIVMLDNNGKFCGDLISNFRVHRSWWAVVKILEQKIRQDGEKDNRKIKQHFGNQSRI